MAKPVNYVWVGADQNGFNISIFQAGAGGPGNLVLDGTLVNPITGTVSFPGCARYISISSGGTGSAAPFTITGTYRNSPVSEVIDSVPNSTIPSKKLYSTITSITVDTPVTEINIGTYIPLAAENKILGYTDWLTLNNYIPYFDVGFAVIVPLPATNVVNYSIQGTMENALEVDPSVVFPTDDSYTNVADTLFNQLVVPIKGVRLVFYNQEVGDPGTYASGVLTATILQQGLRS